MSVSPTAKPKKKTSRLQEGERACAMKLRVYPTRPQQTRLSGWLYYSKKFRNEAVAFCQERRFARSKWLRNHPVLAQEWKPDDLFDGKDASACSKWLTGRLEAASNEVAIQTGLVFHKKNRVATISKAFRSMSAGERDEIVDGWLLSLPRTVFDQVLQDMAKTENKAIGDLANAKKSGSKKKRSGFPQFRKWQFPGSIRVQVSSEKMKEFANHWQAGELFIPGLGRLRFRDKRYVLPKSSPSMITVSRDAAGEYHATFLCVEKQYNQIKQTPSYLTMPLPLDENGFPVARAIDFSMKHLGVDDQGVSLGRKKHLKRFSKGIRKGNKSLARKQKGSKHWHRARREIGVLHVRVSDCRKAELRYQAKTLVDRSAIVCTEDFQLAIMLQNHNLAFSAHDASFGYFKQFIRQECRKQGKLLLECGRFDPTTQQCSSCEFKNTKLKNNLNITAWDCPRCGIHHDRDHNAAINIKVFALQWAVDALACHSKNTSGGDSLVEPENGFGVPDSLRMQMKYLHPDLSAFIARGGLTALLDHQKSNESRRVQDGPGLDGVPEACVLPQQPASIRRERVIAG